ncbi:LysR family transcriptional regulator [Vogesella indigofera]|nr:LysR family transcriptional regulator [Vogesella indigofera]MDC7698342.1 LysR family transcriptional regulator [Vogesella indigofera]
MKFQQINAFKAVIELGTVTAAANYLHIAQPAGWTAPTPVGIPALFSLR